jgi:type IV secretion system protein VirB1
MIPGLEMLACQDLAVPVEVMEHVVRVESSFNPYAIGVVGARLAWQPRSLGEAVATAAQLERDGYNFSLGLAQVNRHNLAAQGLADYEQAFAACPNLAAGARILSDCHQRSGGDWGKAFSCYYSGNFTRGFRDGYVDKVMRSMAAAGVEKLVAVAPAIPLAGTRDSSGGNQDLRARRSAASGPPASVSGPSPEATVFFAGPAAPATGPAAPATGPAAASPVHRQDAADAPFVPHVTGGRLQPPPSPAPADQGDSAFVF